MAGRSTRASRFRARARRSLPTLIAALLHIGALVVLSRVPPPRRVTRMASPPPEPIEVELSRADPSAPLPPPPPSPVRAALAATSAVPRHGAMASAATDTHRPATEPSTEPNGGGDLPAAPPEGPSGANDGEGWTFQPTQPPGTTAPSGAAIYARGAESSRPTSETGGITEALDAHDSSVGLGRGGPAVAALEEATHAASRGIEGWALFDVAIDTSGKVSVLVGDASGDRAIWSEVASAAARALDPRRIRIPPGARGWHVSVRVEAIVRYPDGERPKDMYALRVTPKGPKVTATKDQVHIQLPEVTIGTHGKVCGAQISLGHYPTLAGGCQPENLGSNPVTVVGAHVVNEGRID